MQIEAIWLTRAELSKRLNVALPTLAQWGSQGKGPRYAKFGRHVRYSIADVVAWEQQQYSPARD
ncbi:Helix-turn-helix domain, group 17 [Mycobacteriaceae bacterium]